MNVEDIEIGKWYMVDEYGYEHGIKGKAVEVCGMYVILKFFWGHPFRSKQTVKISRLVEKCKRPNLLGNR